MITDDELLKISAKILDLTLKLKKAEARAEFWHRAAIDWKERFGKQIIADRYPPMMAMDVLKMQDGEVQVFETWEKGKKKSTQWVDTCGGCGNDQYLMEGWVHWITGNDGTEVYTRVCEPCNEWEQRSGMGSFHRVPQPNPER